MTTKTTLYLPDDLKVEIQREARRRATSEAEVIRSALRAGLARPKPRGAVFDAPPFADRVDELLEGFGQR